MNVDILGKSMTTRSYSGSMKDLIQGDRGYSVDYLNDTLVPTILTEEIFPGKGIWTWQNPVITMVWWITSIVLLVVTCVLTLTEKSEKNKHYVPYLVSLSLTYAAWFTSILYMQYENLKYWQCILTGYSLQYFGLSAFFWINAMNIHTCLIIIRTNKPKMRLSIFTEQRWRMFLVFSVYAWGMPLLISAATYSLQTSGILENFNNFKPDIGTTSCFFRKRTTTWIYFFGPIAVLIVANLTLFAWTYKGLIKTKSFVVRLRRRRLLRIMGSWIPREIWFFKQFLELFVVTGITWGIGVTVWELRESTRPWLKTMSQVLEIVISLQGLFIFYIFVIQKKVLVRKLCCNLLFRPRPGHTVRKRGLIERNKRRVEQKKTVEASECRLCCAERYNAVSNLNRPPMAERRLSNIFSGNVVSLIFDSSEEDIITSVTDETAT